MQCVAARLLLDYLARPGRLNMPASALNACEMIGPRTSTTSGLAISNDDIGGHLTNYLAVFEQALHFPSQAGKECRLNLLGKTGNSG
jgi:hypothetical protein